MKILIDMNLSPDWVDVFKSHDIEAAHWSYIGKPDAKDTEVMEYARSNGFIIFTHDLDFGTMLALTRSENPSIIQLRSQNIFPQDISKIIIKHLQKYQELLEEGALIVIDENKARVRILPLRQ
jgi:predicted nuclease of predicted toxin-antitoxin system